MARRSHSAAFAKHAFIRSLVSVLMRTERIFVAVVPLFLVLIRCVQSGTDDSKSCCVPDKRPHTRTIIDHLLPRAKGLAADGEERVRLQEARVVGLERKGQIAPESRKLLKVMRETLALRISHVRLLEREIKTDGGSSADA